MPLECALTFRPGRTRRMLAGVLSAAVALGCSDATDSGFDLQCSIPVARLFARQ